MGSKKRARKKRDAGSTFRSKLIDLYVRRVRAAQAILRFAEDTPKRTRKQTKKAVVLAELTAKFGCHAQNVAALVNELTGESIVLPNANSTSALSGFEQRARALPRGTPIIPIEDIDGLLGGEVCFKGNDYENLFLGQDEDGYVPLTDYSYFRWPRKEDFMSISNAVLLRYLGEDADKL